MSNNWLVLILAVGLAVFITLYFSHPEPVSDPVIDVLRERITADSLDKVRLNLFIDSLTSKIGESESKQRTIIINREKELDRIKNLAPPDLQIDINSKLKKYK